MLVFSRCNLDGLAIPKVFRTGTNCFPWACVRLYDWILGRFDSAKSKGYITLGILRSAIVEEQGFTISKKVLRRTLKAMGFTYKKRKQVWISRRLQPGVQEKKKMIFGMGCDELRES